ncbi:DUF1708 domain-containing protein [Bacillus mycoides]|nr:DUF1708 domain-containing protein [Bacillus mycoides]
MKKVYKIGAVVTTLFVVCVTIFTLTNSPKEFSFLKRVKGVAQR